MVRYVATAVVLCVLFDVCKFYVLMCFEVRGVFVVVNAVCFFYLGTMWFLRESGVCVCRML